MLELLPEEKRKILLEYWFISGYFQKRGIRNLFKRRVTRQQFLQGLDDFKSELNSKGILDSDIEILKRGMSKKDILELINSLPEEERNNVIHLKNMFLGMVYDIIEGFSADYRSYPILSQRHLPECVVVIEQMLNDKDVDVRIAGIFGLTRLQSRKSILLIEQLLRDPYFTVRLHAVEALDILGYDNLKTIRPMLEDPSLDVKIAAAKFFYNRTGDLSYHRLYQELSSEGNRRFFEPGKTGTLGFVRRRKFEKTGSRTVLLGGKYTGKIIVRIIKEESYNAWKKALESDIWEKEGFDYVPVEPIIRAYPFRGKKRVMYRVFAGVIDGHTLARSLYRGDLSSTVTKIQKALIKIEVWHGHPHERNFVVAMHEGKPRLYLIDFDQAISPGP